jgi:citrate synthase
MLHLISREWAERSELPDHVHKVIDAMPLDARPMVQFSTAILSMASDSKFLEAYMQESASRITGIQPMRI